MLKKVSERCTTKSDGSLKYKEEETVILFFTYARWDLWEL